MITSSQNKILIHLIPFILGSFLQKILPVFIYLILKNFKVENKIKLSDIVIIIFTFAIIYRSGDRSAFGLIMFFSLIFFAINKPLRKKMLAILIFFYPFQIY